jgi:Rps23 Pro-64 3,4-dihydroxylase Tpa1-like proline 4-hydroxylase
VILASLPAAGRSAPFPHVVAQQLLTEIFAEHLLIWFEQDAPWRLRVESFYEQYELNLHQVGLPSQLKSLVAQGTIECFIGGMLAPLTTDHLVLVEANAHKLVAGQKIKIHNGYIGNAETHRLLIQINRGWSDENGGLLMLFSSPDVADVARIIRPVHRSAFAFEISPTSYHAVSTILAGARYTLVYSFQRAA